MSILTDSPKMDLKTASFSFFRSLLLIWALTLFAAGTAQGQEDYNYYNSSTSKDLEPIKQAETEALQQQKQIIEDVEKRLPELTKHFAARLQEFIPELNRLVRLKSFVQDNFKELLLMLQFVEHLEHRQQQSLKPLQENLNRLKEAQARLHSQQKDLQAQIMLQTPRLPTEQQQLQVQKLDELRSRCANQQEKIQSSLDRAHEFSQRLQRVKSSLQQDLELTWKSFFFAPAPSIFDISLQKISQDIMHWRQGLPIYINYFLIGPVPWLKLLGYAFVLALFLGLAAAYLLFKLRSRLPDQNLKSQVPPLLLICFSLSCWATAAVLPGAYPSALLMILIQIILLRGLCDLFWKYRLACQEQSLAGKNPVSILWWLFTVSFLLQGIINPPESLMVLVWPLIMLGFIIWLIKSRIRVNLYLERLILFGSLAFLILLTLGTVAGWVNVALLLSAFLFILALCFQFSSIAASMLKSRALAVPESNLGYLRQGLIQGTGIPLLWILPIVLAILWLGVHMGDVLFLKEITELDLGWGAISVNIFLLILILIGFYLAKSGLVLLRSIVDSIAEGNDQLDPGTTTTLKTLMTYVIWSAFTIIVLASLGLNLTSLTVVAGGLSVGIGFGLQSIVKNFISGLILLFGRAIKPGDIIQVGELWAEVKEVNSRCTVVETFDKSSLLLPNSMLIDEQITNWTLNNHVIRRTITVGVAHGSDITMVKRLLVYIAETHPEVLNKPLPFVRFSDIGSSALIFTLYFFALIENAWDTESALRFEIDSIFREYGIQIAFPQQDLHVKSANGLQDLLPVAKTEQEAELEEQSSSRQV